MKRHLLGLLILFLAFNTGGCKKDDVPPSLEHPFNILDNNPDTLAWFDVAGSICRDGSPTGIGVRVKEKKKWMIYINGGGACFNDVTCSSNPSSFNEADMFDLYNTFSGVGIFNAEDERNPVKDWSIVFIPYCTGDVHSGENPNASVNGVAEPQQFVGHQNFIKIMEYIAPYLKYHGVEEVLLFGMSAGGYGVYLNFLNVINNFPNVKITVINDSGLVTTDDNVFSSCLQLGFAVQYNLPIPTDMTDCCGTPELGLANVYEYTKKYYPQHNFGFISSYEDITQRFFLSFGYNNCAGGAPGGRIPGDEFKQALIDLRENILKPKSEWSTFFVNGQTHCLFNSNELYYERTAGGKHLYEWVDALLKGQKSYHLSE